MRPIYTAFFTPGTLYEQEAARLRGTLEKFGLPHDIRPRESRGSWERNTAQTAEHICEVLNDYPDRPVVQLDADAYLWRRPDLFEDGLITTDIAVHYRQGHELLNGTVYFAPNEMAREAARAYLTNIRDSPGCMNEQTMLAKAIEDMGSRLSVFRLPPEYCWIHDIMRGDAKPEDVVIEHLQASRERGTGLLPNRRQRLAEIGG